VKRRAFSHLALSRCIALERRVCPQTRQLPPSLSLSLSLSLFFSLLRFLFSPDAGVRPDARIRAGEITRRDARRRFSPCDVKRRRPIKLVSRGYTLSMGRPSFGVLPSTLHAAPWRETIRVIAGGYFRARNADFNNKRGAHRICPINTA